MAVRLLVIQVRGEEDVHARDLCPAVDKESIGAMVENKKSESSNSGNKVSSISYFTLFRFASKWDKFHIFVALVAMFIAGITTPFGIALVANVFQAMIDYAKSVEDGTQKSEEFLMSMHRFGINYSCVGLIMFAGGYLGTTLMNMAAINQPCFSRDMIKLEEGIGEKVASLIYDSAVAVGCIAMALLKGWKLALLCLTTAPITFLLVGLTGMIAHKLYKKQSIAKGKASAVAEEALGSIKTVYAFNGQQKEIERYKKPLADARRIHIKKEFFTGLSMGFLFVCIFSSYSLAFYLGIFLVINEPDKYNADVMFSVFFGVMTGLTYFGNIGTLMSSFGSAIGAGAHIFHVLDNVPSINPSLDRGLKPESLEGNIEFKDVYFEYPSRPGVTVLDSLNIKVSSGQCVALVGHSGSGKSTVIDLISRFYDVVDGSVSIDGNDVRELSVCWLRAQIGLVSQQPVLFNTSVLENIRYGRDDASDTDVVAAARQANAHEFIVKLPSGYDTVVGDRGTCLSGGQKQRVAIARALVRNPRILLLDEATSALDNTSEAKVQEALNKASKGRTTIIVAHRLSTIRNVDVIYVMKEGKVVEKGNHEELFLKKGFYYEMFQASEVSGIRETDTELDDAREPGREQSSVSKDTDVSFQDIKKDHDSKDSLSFWQVVALNAPEWKTIAVGSVCSVISGFAMPLFIVVFGDLFGSMSNPDPEYLMNKVKNVSYTCVGIGCAIGVANLLETVSFGSAGAYLTERLRLQMFTHLLRQDVQYFDERENSTGALCARLSAEAAYVQGATGQRIGIILQGVGSVGLALSLALWFEWRVGLVALAFLPIVIAVIWQQGKVTSAESSGYAKSIETSTKVAVEAVSNFRAVASLGRERAVAQRYAARLAGALPPARRAAHWRGAVSGLSRSIFHFVNAAALTYGGHLIVSDGVAYQHILITTQSLQMASSQAQNAFSYAPEFQKGIDAAARIVHLLRTNPKIVDPEHPVEFKPNGAASFKEVEFKYPSRPTARVLRGLNLQIPAGQTIALVGQSGCGKSTVIQLLQRYYDPDFGSVALDDIPLSELRVRDVRASFGLVSQEPVLFGRSVADNIAYGRNASAVSEQDVVDAARRANIHDFIVSLPQGYATVLGALGTQLSGGQRQRVAIARALVRDPKLLLLDEATSALDNQSEKVVQEALDAAKAGRTCVLIAHRLSTVRDADAICVLSGGRVAERGTHAQLVQLRGLYYNLYNKS